MQNNFLKLYNEKQSLVVAALFAVFVLTPKLTLAAGAQNISCSNGHGEGKQIYVEPLNAGGKTCRTIYVASVGQSKEIAWAQNNVKFCADVAYRLMSKLTHAGWRCTSDVAVNQSNLNTPQLKTYKTYKHKRKTPHHYVDHALLESIKK